MHDRARDTDSLFALPLGMDHGGLHGVVASEFRAAPSTSTRSLSLSLPLRLAPGRSAVLSLPVPCRLHP
jgi:hypothetical protein